MNRLVLVAVIAMIFGLSAFVPSANAAVTLLSSPTSGSSTNSSVTFSHTNPGGTDTMIIVGVGWDYRDNENLTSVTYAGQTLTCGTRYGVSDGRGSSTICYLLNPPTGTNNVVFTTSGNSSGKPRVAGAVVVAGADQNAPTEYGVGGTATTATLSGITSVGTDMVIGLVTGYKAITAIAPSGSTQVYEAGIDGTDMSNMAYSMGASSLTWNNATESSQWGIAALVIPEAVSCVETATVNAISPGVITGVTAITATLGGSGGSSPQVRWRTDGGAWSSFQNSGATYTPPVSSTGTVDIEAQATGFCGTITDPTPVATTYDTSCTESTPSSISFNGVSTAAGDFSGASMVSPVDLTGLEFRVTEGSGGGAPFSQTDNFDANNFGNWTPWDDNAGNNWLLDNNSTPSSNVGPSADHSGSGYYVYTESSSGSENDVYTLTSNSLDASVYALGVDFWWNMNNNGQAACVLHVDVSTDNGSSWGASDVWQRSGDNGDSWVNQTVDLSGYTGTVKVRFRTTKVGSGSSFWNCDTALDDIVISGPARATEVERLAWNPDPQEASSVLANGNSYNLYARGTDPECGTLYTATGNQNFTWTSCTETNTVNAPTFSPSATPILGDVVVNATGFGSTGAIEVSWSEDGGSSWSSWVSTGSTYTPSGCITGTVLFRAQGNSSCGGKLITEAGSAVVFDTTDPDPSTITIPATQTINGANYDASTLVTTTGDPLANLSLQYKVTQQQLTAGSPIDAGVGATDLGNDIAGYGEFTIFGQTNPSNLTGTIDHIEAWITSGSGQLDVIVGYGTPPNYTVRSKVTVSVTGTGLQTWDAPADFTAFNIQAGDYVGLHNPGGNVGYTYGGGGQLDYLSGDATSGTNTFTNLAADLSVYVTGSTTGSLNEVTCTNWTSTATIPATTVGGSLCGDYTDGSYALYSRGTDPDCGDPITSSPVAQDFSWSSCAETKTLTLTPVTDPITGNVSVTATGTATGIQVGISPAPTNASGWIYIPTQDDNITTVSFYATGTGTCGTITKSQLSVGTNTMAAPTVTAFSVPATVVDTAAPLDVPLTSFTATDNVSVSGYMVTESATAPLAGDAGWSGVAPATYTVAGYGSYTLYAWAKDAAGNVSLSFSAPVTMSNCTPTVTALNLAIVTNPINYPTSSSVITLSAVGGTVTGAQWSSDGGASWSNSGASYTPVAQTSGSVTITGRATENTCSSQISATNQPIALNYDTRSPQVVPGTGSAAQSALDSITVTMPYQGDVNGDATFQVDYRLLAGTWVNGTPTLDTGGSPYTQVISGLNSTATYEVRVTYVDVDGPVNTLQTLANVTMVPWADNPMLHNSLRFTGTAKHGGNWGTPGNYAGGITCATCHAKNTGNVKRIQVNISFPDGSAMPGGGTSAAVSLLTVEDGTSDFGDDSTAPRTSSNKVCEACHSADLTQANGVKQHAANQAAASGHYDNADCIKCHQHSAGFKADCTTCHGNPPVANTLGGPNGLSDTPVTGSATSGKHTLHAVTKAYACNTCHTGWEVGGQMPNSGNINIGFSAFGDTTATYDGRTAGAYTAATGTTVGTGNALTCSAIYCHGTSTPKWLDTEAAMVCGSCHGNATDGAPIETAGDGDLSGATTGKKVGKHVKHIPVSQSETGTACGLCHNGAGTGTALHVNGSNDIIFDTAKAGASATYTPGTSTCSNLSCHGTQVWDTASAALTCDSCHGYPPTSSADAANNKHVGVTAVNHDKTPGVTTVLTGNHAECNTCHGKSQTNGLTDNTASGGDAYLASYHRDGNIEMNGISTPNNSQSAEYDQATFGCAKACHANDGAHQLSDSGLPVQLHEFGAGDCNGCHDAGTGGAPVINAASSHVDADGAGGTYAAGTCTDCHPGGTKGAMHSKNGDVNVVAIANNATVGINYGHTVDTGVNGFVLGGDATTGTTAAQICWNCHDSNGVSEWGTNTDTNGGEPNYNFGTLNNSNWTTANWTSATAMFSYKSGAIQSTHAASTADGATSGVDPVVAIRCSYCHDVHNTTGPNNKPYLRGAWMGNPYPEDGAPQSFSSYTNSTSYRFGAVPRGNSGTPPRATGGYFIDQNRTTGGGYLNITTWSLANNAGLCTMCHGTNVNSMNQYGTASTDWVGTNGHSNAVIGGTGSNKANIFDLRGGSRGNRSNPAMAFQGANEPGDSGNFGFRNGEKSSDNWSPLLNGAPGELKRYNNYSWGATVDGTTTDTQYHKFPCSKCHSPHASRLPRLMITNCLDTKHNSWDDSQGTRSISNYGSNNSGKHKSNLTSAQNCHRVGDPGESGTGAGWNNVTPW